MRWSSLLAVEYTLKAYETILDKQRNPFIGSLCLIASSYVEKHTPNLIQYMIPVVIPALSTARYLKDRAEDPIRIVLATSCLATKSLMPKPGIESDIDVGWVPIRTAVHISTSLETRD